MATLTYDRDGRDLVTLSEQDVTLARASGQTIARFAEAIEPEPDGQTVTVVLTRKDGARVETAVPAFAMRLLARVLEETAEGRQIAIIPRSAELTTHEAASLLGVSRPFLIKQLDAGKLPYRRVGTHRRIKYADLLDYRKSERAEQNKAMDELVRYSEEIGLYDMEAQ